MENGACALRAGYLNPQTHAQNMPYLLIFHFDNGCTNALQCYVIHIFLVLLDIIFSIRCLGNLFSDPWVAIELQTDRRTDGHTYIQIDIHIYIQRDGRMDGQRDF